MIRLDVAAPAPEVMAVGLRNPWRFSFDRATGQIAVADVGDVSIEEITFGLAANYGWPCFEGTRPGAAVPGCSTGTTPPAVEKSHAEGFCAITGGYVVRDPGLPTLFGRYLYGDACVAGLRAVEVTGAGDTLAGVSVAALQLVRGGRVRAAVRRVAQRSRLPAHRRSVVSLRGFARAADGPRRILGADRHARVLGCPRASAVCAACGGCCG